MDSRILETLKFYQVSNMSLEQTLKDLINVLRFIFENDKVTLATIDDAYESALIDALQLIPTDVKDYVLSYVNVVKTAYTCFDMAKFNQQLTKVSKNAFPIFNIDSYKLFEQGLNKLDLTNANKARITSQVKKFKPLFTCIDKIINDARFTIARLAIRSSTAMFDDML